MSRLFRFLGLGESSPSIDSTSDALDEITQQLDELDPKRARFFAAFAYLLARIAGADLRVREDELSAMTGSLQSLAEISPREAELAIQIARTAMEELGGSHNFLVAREFGKESTPNERMALLRCLYTVAAADGIITGDEALEITNIAEEIGLERADVLALRSEFKDKLAEFQKLPGETDS
ncbi:MAG: hypothetical protein CL917_10305 [Deltaproteobacteria bacterium]|nr:hypothetical protein [Deltaproteobacteria bacterium]